MRIAGVLRSLLACGSSILRQSYELSLRRMYDGPGITSTFASEIGATKSLVAGIPHQRDSWGIKNIWLKKKGLSLCIWVWKIRTERR